MRVNRDGRCPPESLGHPQRTVAWPWNGDGRHSPESLREISRCIVMNTAPWGAVTNCSTHWPLWSEQAFRLCGSTLDYPCPPALFRDGGVDEGLGSGYGLRAAVGVGGGGLVVWGPGQPRPTDPPTHIRKICLVQKMKFIRRAGNLRPILGRQTFDPPPLDGL